MIVLMTNMLEIFAILLFYFGIGFWCSHRSHKIAWVDFFWSSSFFVTTLLLSFSAYKVDRLALTEGPIPPWVGLALMFCIWSLRLSLHLFRRLWGASEDTRYIQLSLMWKQNWNRNVFLLYLFEALLSFALSAPLFVVFGAKSQILSWPQSLGFVLFLIGLAGESLSDYQLLIFKRRNRGQKAVCDLGLWKYSRHPNYFFEIVIWISFAFYCTQLPWAWTAWFSPLLMGFLLVKVTGVAPSEKQALETRGNLYRRYQSRTSMLVPWPPKGE
ncbi:MAG: hypothetical protein RJB66_134 [Pseudomonadota bacterium]